MSAPRAVIIGTGFGGLAAAVRLSARGYRVTVLDRLAHPGGRARVFRQDGFVFDAGPTVITAPFLFEELWKLAGRRMSDDVQLVPVDPFYRIRFHDGVTFDYSGDPARMRAEIERIAPGEYPGYERFMSESERIFRVGFERLGHVPFTRVRDMLRVVPDLLRLGGHRSVHQMVARHVRSERLRQALSFHPLLVGGNPFDATSVYALIAYLERKWGVHFAMGGTGAIVRGLTGLIEQMGGEIRLGTDVEEIVVDGGRARGVRLRGGGVIPADVVVSNADSASTYSRLVAPEHRRRWTDRRISRSRFSMGLFVWYFGTARRYDSVAHHTIMLGPRYRGLLDDIFRSKRLARDFSLYLHRPTATDPSLAPRGCDAFYVLAPVPNLAGAVDWHAEATPFREAISEHLERTLLPGLKSNIVTSRVVTPLNFRDDYLSHLGAGFSFEPVLAQSAWFRPHNQSEDIGGLYLVGAGTHPGAGLPGVLSSARVLDSLIPSANGTS